MSTPKEDPYWNSWRNTEAKRLLRPDGTKGAKALANHMSNAGAIVVNLVPLSGDEMRALAEGLRRARGMTCIKLVREARGGGLPISTTKQMESRKLASSVAAKSRASKSHGASQNTVNRSPEDVLSLLGQRVAEHVARSKTLLEIELGVDFGPTVMGKLGKSIAQAQSLRRVSFADSEMGDASFAVLIDGIRRNDLLREIDFSGCSLTDVSDAAVASVVRVRAGRRAQEAWENNLRHYETKLGTQSGFSSSPVQSSEPDNLNRLGLVRLELSYNVFGATTTEAMCVALRQDTELRHLGLRANKMTDTDASRIGKVMREHATLSTVEMCQSRVPGADLGVLKATERVGGEDGHGEKGDAGEDDTDSSNTAKKYNRDVFMDMEWVPSSPRSTREALKRKVARKAERDALRASTGTKTAARPSSARLAKELDMETRRGWSPASGATANKWNDMGTHGNAQRPRSALPRSPFAVKTKGSGNAKKHPPSLRQQTLAPAASANATQRNAPWTRPTLGRLKAEAVLATKPVNNSNYSVFKPTPASASSEKMLVQQLTKALRSLGRSDASDMDPTELRRRVAVAARAAQTADELVDNNSGDDYGGTKSSRIMAKVRADMKALQELS